MVVGERRDGAGLLAAGLCLVTVLSGARVASAIPTVSIEGGSGLPGGTVNVVIALADDPTDSAVAANLAVDYPDPPLAIDPLDCVLADRLRATHGLTVQQPQPGQLDITIAPSGAAPLQNGDLATCAVGIVLGTPSGTAALELAADLRNAANQEIPSAALAGSIFIESAEPTATPTNTDTPTFTPTVTETPVPTATSTVTQTATATLFQPTFNYDREGESCAIVAPTHHSAWPLLGLAALLLLRRRK